MKKALVGIVLAAGALLSAGGVANAYPPDEPTVGIDDPTPDPGGTINVTVENCPDGASVTFELEGSTDTAVASGGSATGTLTAPTAPGTFTGTATCGDAILSFGVVVQAATATTIPTTVAPQLPTTGGNSPGSVTSLAVGLLLAGLGLLGVAHLRRRAAAV